MDEKKMTDEEAINNLELYVKDGVWWGNKVEPHTAMDIIDRLRKENTQKDKKIEYYKDREKSFVNAVEKLTKEKSELKDEIERLTEENSILKENPPILAGRSLGKTIRAKLLAFDKMKEQNAELQKQVDELTQQLLMAKLQGLTEGYIDGVQAERNAQILKPTVVELPKEITAKIRKQAVKDTTEKFAERLKEKLKKLELGGWVELETKCFNEIVDEICKEFTEKGVQNGN